MDDEVFALIERAIRESHGDKNTERLETVGRLRGEADRLQQRLDKLYVDHLDGRITAALPDRMAASRREERAGCPLRMDVLNHAQCAFVDDATALLHTAHQANSTLPHQ